MTPQKPETTLRDYQAVFAVIQQRRLPVLIVGGQAASFWGRYFRPAEPGMDEFLPLSVLLLSNRAFLRQIIHDAENGELLEREAAKAMESLFVFSQSPVATKAAKKWQVNWLQAFPVPELQRTPLPRLQRFYQQRLAKAFSICPPPKS